MIYIAGSANNRIQKQSKDNFTGTIVINGSLSAVHSTYSRTQIWRQDFKALVSPQQIQRASNDSLYIYSNWDSLF
ncbi:hypothetical protein I4U23_000372 [Adineta vaga]|nr:hypothetical protein I4U23_000372 [Adineta vaga]